MRPVTIPQSGSGDATERAADSFRRSVESLSLILEAKRNFNPEQPRQPRGLPTGGQWMRRPGGRPPRVDVDDIARIARGVQAKVDAFIVDNRRTIIRLQGALDTFLGAGEVIAGTALVGIGAPTSEFGVGLPALAAGAWMIFHGHDVGSTGWRALITGEPQETNLRRLLRQFGLSDRQVDSIELGAGLASGVYGAKVGSRILDQAVKRELARRALAAFNEKTALTVLSGRKSLWDEADIRARGDAWELYDAGRTGYIRTPNAKVFDQLSPDGRVAVSNKTLDLQRETYLRTDRKALFKKLKSYVEDAGKFQPTHPKTKEKLILAERRVHLLLRFGDSVDGQAAQIMAAEQYAKDLGVVLKIDYAH